ncbi:MAG TPA: hypothetical protein VGZ90_01215 [Puia sp.]|jgi:hypothetical protein|nr:hypothetical protein [Puia sp.]
MLSEDLSDEIIIGQLKIWLTQREPGSHEQPELWKNEKSTSQVKVNFDLIPHMLNGIFQV